MAERYYKFRSLSNLRRFLDIIVNNRLYASTYLSLNDPMEGWFLTQRDREDLRRYFASEKNKIRICSLSKDYRNTVMWSHYGDDHKGCCIDVSLRSGVPDEVNYTDQLPLIDSAGDVKELLSQKSKMWEYEAEVRLFRKSNYVSVVIHRVIFGLNVTDEDFEFYEELINRINPKISVERMTRELLDTGFGNA